MVCGLMQAAPVDGVDSSREVEGTIDAVTLYNGYAEVERVETLDLAPGVHDLIFNDITDGADLASMRATASEGWTILTVETETRRVPRGGGGRTAALMEAVQALEVESHRLEFERKGFEEDLAFVRAIGVRTSADASEEGGTAKLDLVVVRKQLAFVQETRGAIAGAILTLQGTMREVAGNLKAARAELAAIGGKVDTLRLAKVRLAVVEGGSGEVRLMYGVGAASWEPAYSIRLAQGSPTVGVQYDALVTQASGEDWANIRLTFSTAEPSTPSGPAQLHPVFVDVYTPPPPSAPRSAYGGVETAVAESYDRERMVEMDAAPYAGSTRARKRAGNAYVSTGGTAVTYALPGRVSVPSDSSASRRIRIAQFKAPSTLVYVTRPLVEEKVYLRSDLENSSPFVLLAGKASLFMEGDFVGPTTMPEVGPGGSVEVWWGPDPSVTVERLRLERTTAKTGLFGGGVQTTSTYRIDLANSADKPLTLEVWDRQPVSRNSEIEVRLADVSPPIATDKTYVETAKEQGLLKWVVTLGAKGQPDEKTSVSWAVRVSHSSKITTTPVPE